MACLLVVQRGLDSRTFANLMSKNQSKEKKRNEVHSTIFEGIWDAYSAADRGREHRQMRFQPTRRQLTRARSSELIIRRRLQEGPSRPRVRVLGVT